MTENYSSTALAFLSLVILVRNFVDDVPVVVDGLYRPATFQAHPPCPSLPPFPCLLRWWHRLKMVVVCRNSGEHTQLHHLGDAATALRIWSLLQCCNPVLVVETHPHLLTRAILPVAIGHSMEPVLDRCERQGSVVPALAAFLKGC